MESVVALHGVSRPRKRAGLRAVADRPAAASPLLEARRRPGARRTAGGLDPPGGGASQAVGQGVRRAATSQRAIRSAREALEGGNPSLADRLLDAIRNVPEASESSEYTELRRRAMAGIQREAVLRALGPCRALVDPAATPEPALDVASAAVAVGRSRHERGFSAAASLCQAIARGSAGSQPAGGDEIASVERNRRIHHRPPGGDARPRPEHERHDRPSGAGGSRDRVDTMRLGVCGFGRMPLRDYSRFLLSQTELVLVEEPHRLLITTADKAEERTTTEVYPVADLLIDRSRRRPELVVRSVPGSPPGGRIADSREAPAADRRRVRRDAAGRGGQKLGETLDGTILVDEKALEEAGLGPDTPVTARWRACRPGSRSAGCCAIWT